MTTIDTTELEDVTLDGDAIDSITVDGTEVWKSAILDEGFEDGPADGWTLGPGWSVSTSQAHTGQYSLGTGSGGEDATLDSGLPVSNPTNMSVWVYHENASTAARPILYFLTSNADTLIYATITNGDAEVIEGNGNTLSLSWSVPSDEWFRLSFENLDYSSETFDFAIYDSSNTEQDRLNNILFRDDNVQHDLDDIRVRNFNDETFWIDDILIED